MDRHACITFFSVNTYKLTCAVIEHATSDLAVNHAITKPSRALFFID